MALKVKYTVYTIILYNALSSRLGFSAKPLREVIKFINIADEEDGPSTPSPARLYYDVEVKLVNLGDGFQAPQPGSQDFEVISNTISDNFGPTLTKLPGYYAIKLNELQR